MPNLRNKTILIVSPQSWGKMFVSKHHYAIELAKRGNTVFFLNPPDQVKLKREEPIVIVSSGVQENLFLIEHALFFPYVLKFRALPLFHWLMKFQTKRILKKIDKSIDIVWSFDIGNLYPLKYFGSKPFRIFHPVDEPLRKPAIDAAKGAQVIFSVAHEILEKYKEFKVPRHFINHGVAEEFIPDKNNAYYKNDPLRIGFSGNLLRPDIDRGIVLKIIQENENCIFEFWGSYHLEQTNIGGAEDVKTKEFINTLKKRSNVVLHGVVTSHALAKAIKSMDAFLICYDVKLDQSKGTNYHKVMEYLSTGRVIISNNITTYKNQQELVCMIDDREHNTVLPKLFYEIIHNLTSYNSQKLLDLRIDFARENTYEMQLDRIENIINGNKKRIDVSSAVIL